MADAMSFPPIPGNAPVAVAINALQAEVLALRKQVRTGEVVIVDPDGHEVVRLAAADGGHVAVSDAAGVERVRLVATGDRGAVSLRARVDGPEPVGVDVFALDAEDVDDRAYVGIELIDAGDTVAALGVSEGRRPRLHLDPER